MTVGSYTAAPPFGGDIFSGVRVVNQPANDHFVLDSRLEGAEVIGFKPLARIAFVDASGTSFEDTKLANLGDLTDWLTQPDRTAFWHLAFSTDEGEPNVSGALTSVMSVPEPGTGALLGSGIGLVPLMGRSLRSRGYKGSEREAVALFGPL